MKPRQLGTNGLAKLRGSFRSLPQMLIRQGVSDRHKIDKGVMGKQRKSSQQNYSYYLLQVCVGHSLPTSKRDTVSEKGDKGRDSHLKK